MAHCAGIFDRAALLPEVFCDPDRLATACVQPQSRGQIKRLLLALTPEYQRLALERVPEDFRGYFQAELAKPKVCVGMSGERCAFALAARGGPAQVLGKLRRLSVAARARALDERLPPDTVEYFEAQLQGPAPKRAAGRGSRRLLDRQELPILWRGALASRQTAAAPASAATKKKYREQVLADRARARRRMGQPSKRTPAGEAVENTTGLPPAKRRRLVEDFERWCLFDSWSMCENCGLLAPRDLTESTLNKPQPPTNPSGKCSRCKAARVQPVVTLADVPEVLRELSAEAAQALSPLEIDVGPVVRAEHKSGYRQKTTMIRFRWQTTTVKRRIKHLQDVNMRTKARAAYDFLMASDDTPYATFVAEHAEFLEEHPGADELTRRRRLQFIERLGVECALWPGLFWDVKRTFTHERATDPRRVIRQERAATLEDVLNAGRAAERAAFPAAESDEEVEGNDDSEEESQVADEEDAEANDATRHSMKRLFAALALGRLLGYAGDFELLQFVYDLNLWSSIGSKKNLQLPTPMRLMLKGEAFSPHYWRGVHYALLDMVRQVGYPRIFFTIAPYEWSFPYHEWVRDEMQKLLKERLFLPVAETLHIVHVMVQTVKGLLLGRTGGRGRQKAWKSNIFHCLDEQGQARRLHFFLRLEYQDGTRKAATQDYHGSGRVHVHVVIFVKPEDVEQLDLAETVSATLPEDSDLRGYVEGSQYDQDKKSGWPIHEAPTCFDRETGVWRLQHTEDDHAEGLRPYLVDLMEVLRCHQDFQMCDDDGLLRAYVTKYVSKFSDAASEEWLNDDAEAMSIAATVLMRYRPLEPEMVLQLFGAKFRQWHLSTQSGGKRDLVAPYPDQEPKLREVELYEQADWARGRISLLDYLRKTTAEGKICHWLKKKHAQSGSEATLEDFAANYVMQGEKVVAAETVSKFNDRYFGQWLMLHVPFEEATDFCLPEHVARRLPEAHKYFAMAILCEHSVAQAMWQDDEKIRAELKMEAHTKDHVDTILAMIRAHRGLLQEYLDGSLDARKDRQNQEQCRGKTQAPKKKAGPVDASKFNRQQLRAFRGFKELVDTAVDRALAIEDAEDEGEADRLRQEARDSKANVCLGPPGTGKTTVVFSCIDRALTKGGKVLMALPTAQLASRMKARYGHKIDIDTCHAAFGLHESAEHGEASLLSMYSLIVVDELSQLDMVNFDRILRLWAAAERKPALALLGDRYQMPGMGEKRKWHSRLWNTMCYRVALHKMYRCKDKVHAKLLATLRTGKPNAKLLRQLRKKMAWRPPGRPTVKGLQKLLKSKPNTTILTCTRRGAAVVNGTALKALFPKYPPIATLPADVDSNPENYVQGKLKPPAELQPSTMPVYKGMRVYLTRNVRKDIDFVNGMEATVLKYDDNTGGLLVRTATGFVVSVWPWTDPERGGLVYYPVRPGYASTILKFQGAELPHVVVYLDAPKVPAAAYTAISRVGYYKDFLLAGILTEDHFTPAK
ncbi:unnamed protein product [Symbiodinium natans]|uniref:ATP-dependent DNA helicase PIF1 n=1 Tax=Symbiodinium natans TaxID=878477 RepID=A0A812Q1U8_9DINO|nr:unnamed protein product [Symbiodinium natans]